MLGNLLPKSYKSDMIKGGKLIVDNSIKYE